MSLSPVDRNTLGQHEAAISHGLTQAHAGFVQVGSSLSVIRDWRLYRETHATFDAYIEDRWQMKVRYANRLIEAAATMHNLVPNGDLLSLLPEGEPGNDASFESRGTETLPTSEKQVRPLASLAPETQRTAWQAAVQTSEGPPTEAHVADVARVVEYGEPEVSQAMVSGQLTPAIARDLTESSLPQGHQVELVAQHAAGKITDKDLKEAIAAASPEVRRALRVAGKAAAIIDRKERLAEGEDLPTPPPPEGRYRTIVMDPPWDVNYALREVRPNQSALPYNVASDDAIGEFWKEHMPAADDGCFLFLWFTHGKYREALRLIEIWGFREVYLMTWEKSDDEELDGPRPGMQALGGPRYTTEHVLVCRKGDPQYLTTKAFPISFFERPVRGRHSRKPDVFYDLLRRVAPEPRIDIYNRETKEGFDSWGNEAGKFDEPGPSAESPSEPAEPSAETDPQPCCTGCGRQELAAGEFWFDADLCSACEGKDTAADTEGSKPAPSAAEQQDIQETGTAKPVENRLTQMLLDSARDLVEKPWLEPQDHLEVAHRAYGVNQGHPMQTEPFPLGTIVEWDGRKGKKKAARQGVVIMAAPSKHKLDEWYYVLLCDDGFLLQSNTIKASLRHAERFPYPDLQREALRCEYALEDFAWERPAKAPKDPYEDLPRAIGKVKCPTCRKMHDSSSYDDAAMVGTLSCKGGHTWIHRDDRAVPGAPHDGPDPEQPALFPGAPPPASIEALKARDEALVGGG